MPSLVVTDPPFATVEPWARSLLNSPMRGCQRIWDNNFENAMIDAGIRRCSGARMASHRTMIHVSTSPPWGGQKPLPPPISLWHSRP